MSALKVRDPSTGNWMIVPTVGPAGPSGPPGPTGAPGPATIIVSNFGAVATPADLPVDGLLPVDWDGPGKPATALQVNIGESLYYDAPADPLDGHLFQYVTVANDPTGWVDIGLIQGAPGADSTVPGPTGATGPIGVTGPPGGPVPVGGAVGQVITKIDATDMNVQWGGDVRMSAGSELIFPSETGRKITLYGEGGTSEFGIEVQSGEQRYIVENAANRHGFFVGGAETARITQDGVIAAGDNGFFLGDIYHGWRYDSANNHENLRSYQGSWSFRKTNGSVPGTEVARISESGIGPASNINVSWLNGFSGTCQYRVTPAMVTVMMHDVAKNSAENGTNGHSFKMHAYPAGVPAPWAALSVLVITYTGNWVTDNRRFIIRAATDGMFFQLYDGGAEYDYLSGAKVSCTLSWPRG